MPKHALAAADRHTVGGRPEQLLDRDRLDAIIDLRARAMSIDVADVLGLETSVLESHRHAGNRAAAFGMAVGHAERVCGRAIAGDLGENAGAALLRVFQ